MDKQTTVAFILIGAILIIWLYLTAPDPQKQPPKQDKTETVATDSLVKKENETPPAIIEESNITEDTTEEILPPETFVVETNLARYEFSNKGANFQKIFLKKFNNWYSSHKNADEEDYRSHVQLINFSKGGSYDLALVTEEGRAINTAEKYFKLDRSERNFKVSENDSLQLSFSYVVSPGKEIVKKYTFYSDDYIVKSDIIFTGLNSQMTGNSFDVVWNNGIRFVEQNSVDESNYSNASVFYGDEQVILDASSVDEKESKEYRGRIDWLAVRNKYFAAVIIPENPAKVEGAYLEGEREVAGKDGINEVYNTRLTIPFKNQLTETHQLKLYLGPVDYDKLEAIQENLVALVDFGSFFGLKFIVRPIAEYLLLPLFRFLHGFIPNYGFVIIVFSLIIKIVVYPLTKKSYESMKKMQALQPKIAELKEKYKDDPQKMNKETMGLYSTYGINPAGGCLPILLQMPIFIALWGLFQSAIDLRQQPFILWMTDLSAPDVIYDLGFKLPLFGIQQISALALLMGVTTFFQQKMSVKDPKQQALIYIMPVMLTLLFMSFPSGLNLYYFMFNVLSIGQQYYINTKGKDVELVPVENPKKKKGIMAKMMEAAEQQAKQQQKKKR